MKPYGFVDARKLKHLFKEVPENTDFENMISYDLVWGDLYRLHEDFEISNDSSGYFFSCENKSGYYDARQSSITLYKNTLQEHGWVVNIVDGKISKIIKKVSQ